MFKHALFASLFLFALASNAAGQGQGVFGFNSVQLQNWYRFYGVSNADHPRKGFAAPTPNVLHVSVNGNFGGTFTVHGAGSAASSRSDSYIDITTNRALTFRAANFTILQSGGAAANTAGSISYEMQLYAGTSSSIGAALSGAAGGIDNAFNGASVGLTAGAIPSDNHIVLRLSRTVSLTQFAKGTQDYSASGLLNLTIN